MDELELDDNPPNATAFAIGRAAWQLSSLTRRTLAGALWDECDRLEATAPEHPAYWLWYWVAFLLDHVEHAEQSRLAMQACGELEDVSDEQMEAAFACIAEHAEAVLTSMPATARRSTLRAIEDTPRADDEEPLWLAITDALKWLAIIDAFKAVS